ncbi:hypothetical protein HY333_01145, partial [Candidatus Collierbacteria bacterium]|nr:hypothetical protein [Candidatus Collierbacteria bacterium]
IILRIAEQPFLDIERREVVIRALKLYEESISFVDAVYLSDAKQRGATPLTFDKKLLTIWKDLD